MNLFTIHSYIQKTKPILNWIFKLIVFDFIFFLSISSDQKKLPLTLITESNVKTITIILLSLYIVLCIQFIAKVIKGYKINLLQLISILNILLFCLWVLYFSANENISTFIYLGFKVSFPFILLLFIFGSISLDRTYGENMPDEISKLKVDSPINLEDDDEIDTLGYRAQAKIIAGELLKVNNTKDSFTTAINGKWGSGKSSFMALMKKAITKEEEVNGEILSIVIDFNPWRFDSEKAVIEGYFDELKTALSPYVFGIQPLVSKYVNKLNDVHKHFLIDLFLHLFTKNQSTNDLYSLLSTKLKTLDKKVFVFIDDLDRVDEKEIVAIFKLLRNTSNFPNMIFVLGYEKEYIQSQLTKVDNRYLEKMVQLEYDLNYTEPKYFEEYFFEQLNQLFRPEQIEGLYYNLYEGRKIAKELQKSVRRTIKRIEEPSFNSFLKMDNLRQVNRLVNSIQIKSQYKHIDNVVFQELILLEIMKMNYPKLYETLKREPKYIFANENRTYKRPEIDENGDIIMNEVDKYINSCYHIDTIEGIESRILLDLIFNSKILPNSIFYFYKHDFYFNASVLTNGISIKEFESELNENNFTGNKVDKWIENGKVKAFVVHMQKYLPDFEIYFTVVENVKLKNFGSTFKNLLNQFCQSNFQSRKDEFQKYFNNTLYKKVSGTILIYFEDYWFLNNVYEINLDDFYEKLMLTSQFVLDRKIHKEFKLLLNVISKLRFEKMKDGSEETEKKREILNFIIKEMDKDYLVHFLNHYENNSNNFSNVESSFGINMDFIKFELDWSFLKEVESKEVEQFMTLVNNTESEINLSDMIIKVNV